MPLGTQALGVVLANNRIEAGTPAASGGPMTKADRKAAKRQRRLDAKNAKRQAKFDKRQAKMDAKGTGDILALEDIGSSQFGNTGGLQDRFRGVEKNFLGAAAGADRGEDAAEAVTDAREGSANLASQLQRRQRALGMNLSDRQQASQTRRLSLTRAMSEADAFGASQRGTTDRANMAATEGGAVEDTLTSIQQGGLTQAANAEGQQRIRDANRKAQKDSEKSGLFGSIIGIGASILSSEAVKDKHGPAEGILDRLRKVRVDKWNYKGEGQAHVGPYAEEFNDTFNVNQDNRGRISLVDAFGVIMGGLKELDQKVSANGN